MRWRDRKRNVDLIAVGVCEWVIRSEWDRAILAQYVSSVWWDADDSCAERMNAQKRKRGE